MFKSFGVEYLINELFRSYWIFIVITTLSIYSFSCTNENSNSRKKKTNIIIILADDLGYGDLSCYGHPTIRTPNIDSMAMEGIRLTSFYATPSCAPSRAQLMTGRYNKRINFKGSTAVNGEGGIPDYEVTLAEALKKQGYSTAMIGKWHLGHAKEKYLPTNNGFDSYYGLLYSNDMQPPWVDTDKHLKLYRGVNPIEFPVDQSTLTTRYTKEALHFIENKKDTLFFLYLAYNMPHMPISTSKSFIGKSGAGLYGDVIETIDWSVGCILKKIKEKKIDNNTLVIFTSDNGPWLNAPPRMIQEGVKPWHAGSPGPFKGGKNTTYEGGVRVPAIVRWPNNIPPRQVSSEIVTIMDIYTTLVKIAGGSLTEYQVDGNDILPLLVGKTEDSPTHLYYYFKEDELRAIREGKWKLNIHDKIELFNLDIDPGERYNKADEFPQVVSELKIKMKKFAKELGVLNGY